MRLMPALATSIVLDSLARLVGHRYATRTDADQPLVHSLSAALKTFGSWFMSATIQTCRECCGGQVAASFPCFFSLVDIYIYICML